MNCPYQLPWCVSPALLRRAGTYDGALIPSYGTQTVLYGYVNCSHIVLHLTNRLKWLVQLYLDTPLTSNTPTPNPTLTQPNPSGGPLHSVPLEKSDPEYFPFPPTPPSATYMASPNPTNNSSEPNRRCPSMYTSS